MKVTEQATKVTEQAISEQYAKRQSTINAFLQQRLQEMNTAADTMIASPVSYLSGFALAMHDDPDAKSLNNALQIIESTLSKILPETLIANTIPDPGVNSYIPSLRISSLGKTGLYKPMRDKLVYNVTKRQEPATQPTEYQYVGRISVPIVAADSEDPPDWGLWHLASFIRSASEPPTLYSGTEETYNLDPMNIATIGREAITRSLIIPGATPATEKEELARFHRWEKDVNNASFKK